MNQLRPAAKCLRALGVVALLLGMSPLGQAEPFGTPVKYPRIPGLIIAEVEVDGASASRHDTVGAFVGAELRGKANLVYSQGKAYVALMVNVDGASNTVTLKVHVAETDTVFSATLGGATSLLVIPAGTVGSGESPALIQTSTASGGTDGETGTPGTGTAPFTDAVQYPQIPTVVIAKVNINGQPAADGDLVAALVGTEVRGKGVVVVSGGVAYTAITINVSQNSENASFKIWDNSASTTSSAYIDGGQTVVITPSGSVGSWTTPAALDTVPGGTTPPANTVPIANAGSSQSITEGATVTLDGSASDDTDNDTLTYAWAIPPGSGIALSNSAVAGPTFTAPTVSTATDYIFSLVVNDGTANSTNTATVTITVNPIPPTTSPNDLPFTAVNFGGDANRSAKWQHSQKGIEIEIHYRSEETSTSDNQAIRKLILTSAGTAALDIVNTPNWALFTTAAQLDRAYHVGTDGSTLVATGASDLFSIAVNNGSSWEIDIAQQGNNRGRLTLTDSFTSTGNWVFVSDNEIQAESLPDHSIISMQQQGAGSELVLKVSGLEKLAVTNGAYDVIGEIVTLDLVADAGSSAESFLFSGKRWEVFGINGNLPEVNHYNMQLRTEDGLSHSLTASLGQIDVNNGLKPTSTWTGTGDRVASDGEGDPGQQEYRTTKMVTSVTATEGGNAAFTIRAELATAYRWKKDVDGQEGAVPGVMFPTLDWVEFPFYVVNASQAVNVTVKQSKITKGQNTFHMADGSGNGGGAAVEAPTLYLYRGKSYTFSFSGFATATHPFYLSTTGAPAWAVGAKNGEYTSGVTSASD
ncbi:MAG: hypothetical protein HN524_09035, partial [Verrucomicrobia bacterium]|nr:hypothetical protein [Verrucomicrobiota bacterium]